MFHGKCVRQLRSYVKQFHDYATRTQDDIAYLRAQVRGLQERNDRLVEALSRREGTQLQLPVDSWAPPDASAPGPTTDTGLNQWWKAVGNSPRISSPVKEDKVPAPNS